MTKITLSKVTTLILVLAISIIFKANANQVKSVANFDFLNNDVRQGFQGFTYSDIDHNCGVYAGESIAKLCNENGEKIYFYYNHHNNDHIGWLRYGTFLSEKLNSISGSSLKVLLTGGAYPDENDTVQFEGLPVYSLTELEQFLAEGLNPYGNKKLGLGMQIYFKTKTSETPFSSLQNNNRLSVWVYVPTVKDELAEYSSDKVAAKRPNLTFSWFPFIDSSKGGHYYHTTSNIPMGSWTHYVFDAHPTHHNAGMPKPYGNLREGGYDASGNGVDYFNRIVTYSFAAGLGSGNFPYAFYIDEMESYKKDYENEETIVNMGVGFSPQQKLFDISFNDKYRCGQCYAEYEVRYSFSPIDNGNFNSALIPELTINFNRAHNNADGKITKPNPGYNQIWAAIKLQPEHEEELHTGKSIYFAVKDVSSRSGFNQDSYDLETILVPNIGQKRRVDLIKTIDYTIHEVVVPPTIKIDVPDTIFVNNAVNITTEIINATSEYQLEIEAPTSLNAKIVNASFIALQPSETGTYSITLTATTPGKPRILKYYHLNVIAKDCRVLQDCHNITLVDFNLNQAQSNFGLASWNSVIHDKYTGFYREGTSIVIGSNHGYDYQGVKGSHRNFVSGDVISATFVNHSSNDITFTPSLSFTDPDRRGFAEAGEWFSMSTINIPPEESRDAYFIVNNDTEGSYNLVNISVNKSNNRQIVLDKIILDTTTLDCADCNDDEVFEIEDPLEICDQLQTCEDLVLVDFNQNSEESLFELKDWNTIFMDKYTGFFRDGTSITIGQNGGYDFQGVSGVKHLFRSGETIKTYIFNYGSTSITFTPKISFEDPDRRGAGQPGKWYDMSTTTIPAGESIAAEYVFNDASIGLYERVNVSINFANNKVLAVDKLVLQPPYDLVNEKLNCPELDGCQEYILVDFDQSQDSSLFELPGWDSIITDIYTAFFREGTSISIGSNGGYDFQGVTGEPRLFQSGEAILVTFINHSLLNITFSPRISFTDNNRIITSNGDWFTMSNIELAPGERSNSIFVFDSSNTGEYSLVNISINHNNHKEVVVDSILLSSDKGVAMQ